MNSSQSQLNHSKSRIESEAQQNEEYIEDLHPEIDRPDDQQDNSSRGDNSQVSNEEDNENDQSEEYEEDGQSVQSGEDFDENFSEKEEEEEEKEQSYNKEISNNNESSFNLDEDYDFLQPERKITYKLFRFLNNLRESYRLNEFYQDLLGNKAAMAYANYLLKEKENETVLKSLYESILNFTIYRAIEHNYVGNFKNSSFSILVDVGMDIGQKKNKYTDYTSEFLETHSTLIEFENHRLNLLSTSLNTVSFGMAFNEEKVVIVDLFTLRDLTVDNINISTEMGTIVVKGHMLNDKFGVYVMRIVNPEKISNTLAIITPQNIISPDMKVRPFTGSFNAASKIIQDPSPKILEIYIREKPNSIKYNSVFTGSVKLEDLILAYSMPLDAYPNEIVLREQKKEDDDEKRRIYSEMDNQRKEKDNEKEEKEYRLKKMDNEYGKNFFKIGEVDEDMEDDEEEEEFTTQNNKANNNKGKLDAKKTINELTSNISNPSDISDINSEISGQETGKKENYQKQLDRLESNIEELKRENEEYQKKIKIIYDFKKKEGRDDRNYYKDSNINDSTYTDSLNSASVIHNELNTQKKILKADLEKYNQTVEIQQQRKQQIYRILMNYKEELIANAEYRKGTKISRDQKDKWTEKEKEIEEEIKKLRIENIKSSFELNRLNKELKKLEEYFEGLHVIDFEQLKIENNTLTEKIEDRNEEIHKFKSKINSNVQVLAHLQEKFTKVNNDLKKKKDVDNGLLNKLKIKKDDLDEVKKKNENKTIKKLKMKQKIDQINSNELKDYYSKTNKGIESLISKINSVTNELVKYRSQDDNDIKLLISRTNVMIEDFKNSQEEKNSINKASD